jgi:predicted nucleic acid-binding protein
LYEYAIVNASPIILLAKANLIELLKGIALDILIPGPVALEISQYAPTDPARCALATSPWITVVNLSEVASAVSSLVNSYFTIR